MGPADAADLGMGTGGGGGAGPTSDFPGGGLGSLAGGVPGDPGMPNVNAPPDFGGGLGPGGGNVSDWSGMGLGGPSDWPGTSTNVTAPESQAPPPGTDTTSVGGTQSQQTPGQTQTPPPQQGGGQLQQVLQQLSKITQQAGGGQQQASPSGPSNLSPTLADLSRQTQTALRPRTDAGPTGPGDIPLPGQDLTTGSQHEGGTGLLEAPGGGLGQLGQSDDPTLPATHEASPDYVGHGLGELGTTYNPQLPRTEEIAPGQGGGPMAGTGNLPQPPPRTGAPQGPAGGQAGPTGPGATPTPQAGDVPLPTPRPTGAPQTTATPGPTGQPTSQPGQRPWQVNPLLFLGDMLQAFLGNPGPLLKDLAAQGLTPQMGQGPQVPQTPQTPQTPQRPEETPAATEEERQRQQRQQDLGRGGRYMVDDNNKRIRVKTDAQGQPLYDNKGNLIPDNTPAAPNSSNEAQDAAHAATGGQNDTQIPQHVLQSAQQIARQGSPAAVQQWMAQHGYRRDAFWCGDFVNAVMRNAGLPSVKGFPAASNWRNWGTHTDNPKPGDIAIDTLSYKPGHRPVPIGAQGSHVTVVEKVDPDGTIHTIGGNQGRQMRGVIRPGQGYPRRGGFEFRSANAAYPAQPLPAGQNRPPANVPNAPTQQPRTRGLDLIRGGPMAQRDGGEPIQFAALQTGDVNQPAMPSRVTPYGYERERGPTGQGPAGRGETPYDFPLPANPEFTPYNSDTDAVID